jgi:hypothetical protein
MTQSNDGCLSRPVQKTAGATLYLIEELGDARLRCDQLMRYIDEAVKLIEKSSKKDHFMEVAGHLITGMPETAFKLQKSLQAVALAADRIDYEELKQELRPEKVEELERVLKEVRIRPVQHRSENPMITPKQAAVRLREFSRIAREEGSLPLHEVAAFIGELDPTRQASAALPVADALDKLAGVLESPTPQTVTRQQLATLLSRMAMESEFDATFTAVKSASNRKVADSDSNKLLASNFESIRSQAIAAARAANVGRWRAALLGAYYIVDEIGTVLVKLGSMDTQKSEALKREIRQQLPNATKNVEEMSEVTIQANLTEDAKRSRFEEGKPADPTQNMSPDDAKEWKAQTDDNKDNFKAASGDAVAEGKLTTHLEGKNGHTLCGEQADPDTVVKSVKDTTCYYCKQAGEKSQKAASALDWKVALGPDAGHFSKFEEGKPADPTENMSPEDAKKWKTEHENNKDKFKAAGNALAWKVAGEKVNEDPKGVTESKAKKASDAVPQGTELTVLLRKGPWPTDMFTKGSTLVVKDGGSVGSVIKLSIKGQTMGGPYEFKILSEKEGIYTLLSNNDKFGARGLKVKIKS